MTEKLLKPELMSPAGHWPQLLAAIEAGADAVYFGLDHFSARAKVGFTKEELPSVVETLHARGVKGFVTFNTLVFDDELQRAEDAIIAIAESGADAIIVQDTGIAKICRQIAPELDVHGSTQMSITSAQGAEFAKDLGCARVVLGRELSLKDIQKIREATDVQLEVFVHGALCVSYSGQCFSSEAWGGRSANRGKCAQACRLSYDLIVDGHHRELGPERYLLSPGDLYALEQIPELVRLGISCVKIEGRYKDENYVALTTAAYRKAIDEATQSSCETAKMISPDRKQLEQVYSRGLGPYFMAGVNHQNVVEGRVPRHRGLKVGSVHAVKMNAVHVLCNEPIRPGDGVVFDAADWRSPDEPEEGGNVYEVNQLKHVSGKLVELKFGSGDIEFYRIRVGDLVWRTADPKLLVQLKPLSKPKSIQFTRPVSISISAQLNQPLRAEATIEDGMAITVESESNLALAEKRALDLEGLRKQFGRLGDSPFHLGKLEFQFPKGERYFLPVSQLNEMRRKLVDGLVQIRISKLLDRNPHKGVVKGWLEKQGRPENQSHDDSKQSPNIHLLVRTAEQLEGAISCKPASITLDYLELYGLRPAVEKIRAAGILPRVASPRILKPAEQNVIRFLLSLECPILVRSAGLFHDLLKVTATDRPLMVGDFSLNIANAITAKQMLEKGLGSFSPTYDLNSLQIKDLCQWVEPSLIEVIAFSHLPVFHTEHCVFCRFMSEGTDHTNCGHPCESHRVALRDNNGREHPVMADVGCRNTVFGAEAQVMPESLSIWREAGIRNLRIEFVHESRSHVLQVHEAFSGYLDGQFGLIEFREHLNDASPTGLTDGSLHVPKTVH